MSDPGRCRIEAELRLPAAWTTHELVQSRLAAATRGQTGEAVAAAIIGEIAAKRTPGAHAAEAALGFTILTRAEREEVARRLEAALAAAPVRRAEAQARAHVEDALAAIRARGESEGIRWLDIAISIGARCYDLPAADRPAWHRWLARTLAKAGPREARAPHLSARLGYTLIGDPVSIRRAVERDRAALARAGELAWFAPRFEERRRQRRDTGASPPGVLPLPPLGARLISLLREIAACLRANDADAAFTVARALAVFAQSQPDVTRLLMRDPRSARPGDGFAADEPADVDFELQKTLRALQARQNLAGLRDLFYDQEPRLGIIRLIDARIRAEAEGNASPYHAAAFARVFGDADQALRHLEAMERDGLLLPARMPA